jgi:hypothetical protein
MGYTYEWKVKGLRKGNSNDVTDAIIGTQWTVIATDETDGITGEFNGATPFDLNSINTGSFIAFSELQEEQVIGWIKEHVSGSNRATNYWDHIQGRIDKDIQAKRGSYSNLLEDELPWKPNPTTYTGPNGNGGA